MIEYNQIHMVRQFVKEPAHFLYMPRMYFDPTPRELALYLNVSDQTNQDFNGSKCQRRIYALLGITGDELPGIVKKIVRIRQKNPSIFPICLLNQTNLMPVRAFKLPYEHMGEETGDYLRERLAYIGWKWRATSWHDWMPK